MGLNLEESNKVAAVEDSGLVVMVCHSLRYAPHRELRRRVATGELQIPMDLTIGMRSNTGALATVAMSFNNHATISIDFRLIGEENTYLIAGGKLTDWEGNEVESKDPGPGQDQGCLNAIKTGTKPLTSVSECLPVMQLLNELQQSIDGG